MAQPHWMLTRLSCHQSPPNTQPLLTPNKGVPTVVALAGVWPLRNQAEEHYPSLKNYNNLDHNNNEIGAMSAL